MKPTSPTSLARHVDDVFIQEVWNLVEALINLNYLVLQNLENPEKVRLYAGLAQKNLQAMVELLQPPLKSNKIQ